MPQDREQQLSSGDDDQQVSPSEAQTQESPVKDSVQHGVRKERVLLGLDSSTFTDMLVRFSKDRDFTDGFTMKEDSSRFVGPRSRQPIRHAISFCVSVPGGRIEVKEVLSLCSGTTIFPIITRVASIPSGNFTVHQSGLDVSNDFIFRIMLGSGKQVHTSVLTYRDLSEKRTDLMYLKVNEETIRQVCYLEVRIPHQHGSDSVFDEMQRALGKLSSPSSSALPTSRIVSKTPDLSTTRAPASSSTNTRRVEGADFGAHFMMLSVDEKMTAIDKKMRTHVRDEQQQKECEEMIKEFEQAVELDAALGPLGNGNVSSRICRMTREEVPHEMLDLFLMMGRLRVHKKKESTNKKRKWDITGF